MKRTRSYARVTPNKRVRTNRSRFQLRRTRYRLQDAIINVPVATPLEFDVAENQGFNSSGFDLVFAIRQRDVAYSISGAIYLGSFPFENASPLASVYDEYRIQSANVKVLFQRNVTSAMGESPGTSSPLLYGVVDYTDGSPLNGVTNALAYANCKIMNLGVDNRNGEHMIYGGKLGVQFSVDSTTAGGTRTLGATKRAPWCRTEVTDVEHNGFKFWLDPAGVANVNLGKITFIVQLVVQYRQLH